MKNKCKMFEKDEIIWRKEKIDELELTRKSEFTLLVVIDQSVNKGKIL